VPQQSPASTYRVQVRPSFDLDATAGLCSYLRELGISHLYTAPLLTATPGSEHGYDVVDHRSVNPELGGEEARLRLVEALREHDLGLVVDIVPNHMGVAVPKANPAWWDVLTYGRDSAYAHWFDIDWAHPRIVLPVLGDDGEDDLRVEDGELRYFEHRFPIAPGTGDGDARHVHSRQHYELVSWRRGNTDLTYRRFFAIVELAGLRVEDDSVFDATHREILRWQPDGIRVDHPDGLRDPGRYVARLRAAAPDAWLVVEKILEAGSNGGEALDPSWPVDGTTGYDALREVGGVFIDPTGEAPFTELHKSLDGPPDWHQAAYEQKLETGRRLFTAELRRLAELVPDLADARAALGTLAAAYDVYRTYLPAGQEHLDRALAVTRLRRPDLGGTLDLLARRLADPADELAQRFQQLTGAVMAKGIEDTASYQWTRFVALNEVGGDPSRFGVSVEEFHRANAARQADWPSTMTTLSTHDTKRGEDVRARLAVLSEIPGEWANALARWRAAMPVPDPMFEHLMWQTVVGTWPIQPERLLAYLQKAAREASRATSWTDPDEAFEGALRAAVDRLYADAARSADVTAFAERLTTYGWTNSLGQKLLQLMGPGVPDTYQGTELWDNSLVDPDNRRPVDFAARGALLRRLDAGWRPPIDGSGAAKLLVVSRGLRVRRDRPLTSYAPVPAEGPAAEHVVAFDRGGVVAVATRLPVGLERRGGWAHTVLSLPGTWHDALVDRPASMRMGELLDQYPVALLVPSR
jgi:(1->4)-alpha-D-glucan 1-alpha-D-glucosylmutase